MFYEDAAVGLAACAWLHNFQRDPDSALLDKSKFAEILREAPLFAGAMLMFFQIILMGASGTVKAAQSSKESLRASSRPARN